MYNLQEGEEVNDNLSILMPSLFDSPLELSICVEQFHALVSLML